MAKGSAVRAAKAASDDAKHARQIGEANLRESPAKSAELLRRVGVPSRVLAVEFERGRALQIPGMGNAFERIDTRPTKVPGGGIRPSKGARFTLSLAGPLILIGFTRPDGVECVEGFPIVGNIRRITFDPAG